MTDGNTDDINVAVRYVITDLDPIMQPDPIGAWVHMENYHAQTARIEELEAELEHNKELMLALAGDKINLVSELAGVKAMLAKAVLSVKRLSTSECFGSSEVWGLSLSDSPLGREILARMDYANATLAELK